MEKSLYLKKSNCSLISLLTDFGLNDEYVGVMKGVILNINPQAKIVDLCHNVLPYNIIWPAYLLASCYNYFPERTIFVNVVDPGVGSRRDIICTKIKNYIFLSPDNGLLTLVLEKESPEVIIKVTNKKYFLPFVSNTFHGRDIFAPVAGFLSKGVPVESLGKKVDTIEKINIPRVKFKKEGREVEATIIHIDRFGNLVSNITEEEINNLRNKSKGSFKVKIKDMIITQLCTSYGQGRDGELISIFGSRKFLEISANCASAEKILQAKIGDEIEIKFGV